jgi:YD repeat-containing protein
MKIGYKATKNGKCISLIYEVGKTYTFNGDIKICQSGFHYCKNVNEVLKFYPLDKDLVVFEIEDLGTTKSELLYDKQVTDKIKILRQVFPASKEIQDEVGIKFCLEYNKNNQIVHKCSFYNGTYDAVHRDEFWAEYDEDNNPIHYKYDDGYEEYLKYNDKHQVITFKNTEGFECVKDYDTNGNMISYRRLDGERPDWSIYKYDKNNNEIYFKSSIGSELWHEYDENNKVIHFKNESGYEYWNEYDQKGNLIHKVDSHKNETWYTYDNNNNIITLQNLRGNEKTFEQYSYNENNKLILRKDCYGRTHEYEYDKNNNEIHYKESLSKSELGVVEREHWQKFDDKNNLIGYRNIYGVSWSITIE